MDLMVITPLLSLLQAFGVDDTRMPLISLGIFVSLAALFNTWGKTQDEEDFLDVYKVSQWVEETRRSLIIG